ncbi:MAG: hypothetical protein LBR82_09755 [Desulfovibrio sp.]|jgi:hypothetical protein|nr:hypothetical protein [Desulfovibrio sp.]
MDIQATLLPNKHVPLRESVLALAGHIRTLPAKPRTLDELWAELNRDASPRPGRPSLDDVVYALDVLFALKQVTLLDDDRRFILGSAQ